MLASPEVSVVIPTRSRWQFLAKALEAALGQQEVDLEVVVVDDASTDETPRRLQALDEPRLRVIRKDTTRGPAVARNAGIAAALGQWIAFLDDDDVWSPLKLRRQLDVAASEGASFAYAGAVVLDEKRAVVDVPELPDPTSLTVALLRRNVISGGSSNVIVRAELLRKLEGFDVHLFHLADWDLWIRLATAGRAAACPEILVGCLEHAGNMLLTQSRGVKREYRYLVAKHRPLARAYGAEFDDLWFAGWLAWGHAQAGRRLRSARIDLWSGIRHRDRRAIRSGVRTLAGTRLRELIRVVRGRPKRNLERKRTPGGLGWLSLYR